MSDFKKQVVHLKNMIRKNFIHQDDKELDITRFTDEVIKEAISDYFLRSKLNMRLEDGVLHISNKDNDDNDFIDERL
jgi:hypothetical protein